LSGLFAFYMLKKRLLHASIGKIAT